MSVVQDAIKQLVLRKGAIASSNEDWVYGWYGDEDYEHATNRRKKICGGWVETPQSEIIEYTYDEFIDTFAGNHSRNVLAISHVACMCGKYKDVTVGVQGSTGDLLSELLTVKKEYK